MTKAKKILFITQEITPFVADSPMAGLGRRLPQAIQDSKYEIRTFMPKWGTINERRNQLHEVIRLSGMNLIIDETDHPLIIKVASIPAARMQVYFIDNDDCFARRKMARDDKGLEYKDNAERAVFYARGVLETVKKLRWTPDVVHCQGWMTALVPMYLKSAYAEEPSFRDCRVVYTPSDTSLHAPLPENFRSLVAYRETPADPLRGIQCKHTQALNMMGMRYADGVSLLSDEPALQSYAKALGKPFLGATREEDYARAYGALFEETWATGRPQDEDGDNA